MKRSITITILAVVAALVIFAGVRQILLSKAELAPSITQLHEEQGVPVEVTTVTEGTFTLSRFYLGTVEGELQADVFPSIMEEIVAIPVKAGDRVRVGQVVCRLDTRSQMAQYNQLKLAYEDAQREADRMENLFETGAVSRQMLDKARLARDISRQNLQTSSRVVSLTAPIGGVVTDVFYRPGETAMPGEPVVRIADVSRVKITFPVNYEDWKRLTLESSVFIRVNGDGGSEIPGTITDISMSADPKTRLFNVWVAADNAQGLLQPGLLVDARVVVIQNSGVTLLPRETLLTRQEKIGVFVVVDGNRAAFTPLVIGNENTSVVEVISGVVPGQIVVTYGQNNLNDGQRINIVNS